MPTYQDKFYGLILSEIRRNTARLELTQAHVADHLGIKQSAVSSLFSAKSRLSLDQFLKICELIEMSPDELVKRARNLEMEVQKMTPKMEATVYRSEAHLLAYCACSRWISLKELKGEGITFEMWNDAIQDLIEVELVEKKGQKYRQKNPKITYVPSTRLVASKVHNRVVHRSWQYFDKRYNDREFISTKFNLFTLDRFSVAQSKEIEAMLWKVYEKITLFRQENQSESYAQEDNMPLWNLHLMLMTPIES